VDCSLERETARSARFFIRRKGGTFMKYGLAWLIGVPPVLIAGWFLLNHC
jgi:hypothetical protein